MYLLFQMKPKRESAILIKAFTHVISSGNQEGNLIFPLRPIHIPFQVETKKRILILNVTNFTSST